MCNRARNLSEPPTLFERFGASWLTPRPMDNRFNPAELYPKSRAWVLRSDERGLGVDMMHWDVLGGIGKWPMTNVRQLGLPQWRRLAALPGNRCLIPLTEFAEWTPEKDPVHGIKGEMWFDVPNQSMFAIGGFWQPIGDKNCFAMVTCDPNELVAPIHPKAMITILQEHDWDKWLHGSYDDVVALQRPFPAAEMTVRGPVFPTRDKAANA
jgi:putative SOS response-associated peptidase YedK